jgi:hypothetical protein
MRQDEHLPNRDEAAAPAVRPGLLDGRRKILIGSVGLTAFAATLHARRAFANGQGNFMSFAQQQACSPHPSSPLTNHLPTSYHCDYWTGAINNWQGTWASNWQTWNFTDCGWSPPSGYGISGGQTLTGSLTGAYAPSSGRHVYQTSNNHNLGCWIACGFLCAHADATGFQYTVAEFATACTNVLRTSNCSTQTISTYVCAALTAICTNGYQGSHGVQGGQGTCWP